MARAGIRIGIVALGLVAAVGSLLLCAVGIDMLDEPHQRVGVHLEIPGEAGADEHLMEGVRRSLPRLLYSAQAKRVKVRDIDPATLEVTFTPPQPWSELHGLRAEGNEAAPELVPDGLRTLLTAPCDLRLLEVVDQSTGREVERDRTARLLEGHPERALESLRASLRAAAPDGHVVAWCPLATGGDALVPVLVEGAHDRQVTILDLASASRGSGSADIELHIDEPRRVELEAYLHELAGRRIAIVVDGSIAAVGEAHAYRKNRLGLEGKGDAMTAESCAAILSRIRQPLLPQQARITRSWITPTRGLPTGSFALMLGIACGLFAAAMAWAFVRDVRRPPEVPREVDWSSGS